MSDFKPLHLLTFAAIVVPFAAFILFAATRMPMSYDDAFNATLPLNLLRGNGYATHFARLRPFDPVISTGVAFLAPAVLPMAVFGTDMQSPMVYAAVVCLALYVVLLRSVHTHSPAAALATAIMVPFTLWQGKNDRIVTADVIPAPPFGYWYQLLGNLPGVLALALAMSLLLAPRPATVKRAIAVVALVAFAVNGKLMHVIPLAAMILTWVVLPVDDAAAAAIEAVPSRRFAIALAMLAAGACGAWLNVAVAWLSPGTQALATLVAAQTTFFRAHDPLGPLLAAPLPALPGLVARSIIENSPRAADFVGGRLAAGALAAGLLATALLAVPRARTSTTARLGLVFVAAAVVHLTWWMCLVAPRSNHLSPVPALACLAIGCGFGVWWETVRVSPRGIYWWRRAAWGMPLALICALSAPSLAGALGAWTTLREYRDQQLGAAAALDRLAASYPDAAFCAPGWWVPRELTYLAAPGTRYCDLNQVGADTPGRRLLMRSSNLWPAAQADVRAAAARCGAQPERIGRFELSGCDGFQP